MRREDKRKLLAVFSNGKLTASSLTNHFMEINQFKKHSLKFKQGLDERMQH
jgi:hypothetical protein